MKTVKMLFAGWVTTSAAFTAVLAITLVTTAALTVSAGDFSTPVVSSRGGSEVTGGPTTFPYTAVCHASDLSYYIFISQQDVKGTNKVIIRNANSADPRSIVRTLKAREVYTLRRGQNRTFIGREFTLEFNLDQRLPGGAGYPGSLNTVIRFQKITRSLECSQFPRR